MFFVLDLKEDDANARMAIVLWQLWKDRNDALWSFKVPNSSITIRLANLPERNGEKQMVF